MTKQARLDILVFAAGASRRMLGADKLMQSVGERPLLVHVAQQALKTGHPVTVLLAPDRANRIAALDKLDLGRVLVADAAQGMSASIRAGINALPDRAIGAMFLMADMPDLRSEDLSQLIKFFVDAGGDRVIRATAEDGTPGSPAIVPRRLFAAFKDLSGDQGGREVMRGENPVMVPLPGRRALTDLDTPEDWAAWRESQAHRDQ